MATYLVFGRTADTSVEVTSFTALQDMFPRSPEMPSLHILDLPDQSIQIDFGNPDRDHPTVKSYSAFGVGKKVYDSIDTAISAFMALAQTAL